MNLQLQSYIPVSVPTQIQAGREHIRTVLLYITVRSTPSAVTQTRCLPGRDDGIPYLRGEMQKVLPVVNTEGSDSAMLDNTLEFLVMSGMDLPLAVMITIPEPWANNAVMSQKKKDFYQYYATMMEPWDGPASILFSDGDVMGAVLDRNGLRPSRYYITDDDHLILSSEVGVLDPLIRQRS